METSEAKLNSGTKGKVVQIFPHFMARVAKFEELSAAGHRFLVNFRQGLEFIRRPPIDKTSEIFEKVIEANNTNRMQSYIKAASRAENLNKSKSTINELECLVEDVNLAIEAASETSQDNHTDLEFETATFSELQTSMECRNQIDSIMLTLLRSAMDDALKKIASITSPTECLIETSKFYELAIIQTNASLKLVSDDQILETSRKTMITDLIDLKNLLHDRVNNTKRLIIEKDEVCDQIKSEPNAIIEQMKSDTDMLKERFDLTFMKIDQTKDRCLDQQRRCLIENEMNLITVKGYIHDQRLKHSEKDAIIARLMEEKQQSALQTMTMEEHYMVLLNECYKDFRDYGLETKVSEDVFVYVLHEVVNDWRVYEDNRSINMQLTEDVYQSGLYESMKDMGIKFDSMLEIIQNEINMISYPFITDFQENVNKKLHTNLIRLDELKQRVDWLSGLAASIRNEELVYKKAFARRCENLLLAETEVDLLGDQVEALQDLLLKIYLILEQDSSLLSHNNQVMNILKAINRELNFV